ncbi:hypothetical protein MKW98_012736, partial [Papaver atlanticum]
SEDGFNLGILNTAEEKEGGENIVEVVDLKSAIEIDGSGGEAKALLKTQQAYRGYRTLRKLADFVVLDEEYWWQVIDFARLNHSTISFFNMPETPISMWNRVALNASKVGHGLHLYYEEWSNGYAGKPFFYWLYIGDGKSFDLKECPRSKLRQQCIKYLGP